MQRCCAFVWRRCFQEIGTITMVERKQLISCSKIDFTNYLNHSNSNINENNKSEKNTNTSHKENITDTHCASHDVSCICVTPEEKLENFKNFYSMLTKTKECTSLPPTALGYAGSERILNNLKWYANKWQASCIELREREQLREKSTKSLESNENYCYKNIDFAALRADSVEKRKMQAKSENKRTITNNAEVNDCHKNNVTNANFHNAKDDSNDVNNKYQEWRDYYSLASLNESDELAGVGKLIENDNDYNTTYGKKSENNLEVVHYYETSCSDGLRGYQEVALKVYLGELPGECRNFASEGGFAVWIVPHHEYLAYCARALELTAGE